MAIERSDLEFHLGQLENKLESKLDQIQRQQRQANCRIRQDLATIAASATAVAVSALILYQGWSPWWVAAVIFIGLPCLQAIMIRHAERQENS